MEIRTLELYEPIICATTEDSGSGILRTCTSSVSKKNLNPSSEECISKYIPFVQEDKPTLEIGSYLFCQGFLPPDLQPFDSNRIPCEQIKQAALEQWLEFIWLDKNPADNKLYVRILLHEGKYTDKATGQKKSAGTVFQLFRRIK